MIEDVEKSLALMERMRAALPIDASVTAQTRSALQEQSKEVYPRECRIIGVRYLGDEGGILCDLDFGFTDSEKVHFVSVTHLRFDRRHPLARQIEAYCKHRVKRLKKIDRGAFFTL